MTMRRADEWRKQGKFARIRDKMGKGRKGGGRRGGSGRKHSSGGRPSSYRVSSSSFSRNGADQAIRGSRNNGYLSFADAPLAAGESRLAFRCRVQDGCYRGYTEGSYCIFKVFKNEHKYQDLSVGHEDVTMQVTAKRLAEEFNRVCQPTKHGESCPIVVRDAALGSFSEDRTLEDESGYTFDVERGSSFLLEREIRGSFDKFSSNSGWTSGIDPILEAFSHWSWVKSGETQLVCDLQGHRGDGSLPHLGHDYYYLLTDPAICSSCRCFGMNDLGKQGIDAFFRNHVCNEWCEKLDIEYEKPQYSTAIIPAKRSTSYFGVM